MDAGIITVAVAVGINAVYAVRHGHNVFITFVGGGVLMLFVSALDALPGSNMGTAVGGAFLLGTIIYRGQDLLSMLTSLMGG
jgi:hypothetical protein